MEEFVQEFRRAARGSGYEGRPLVSRSQKVDLVSFYFLSHFYFIFDLFFHCFYL